MGKFLEVESLETIREPKLVRWVDPNVIKYLPKMDFKIDSIAESICAGDWDLDLTLLDESEFHVAAKDVFFHSKNWNDTDYFNGRLRTTKIKCEQDRGYYKMMRCSYINYLFNAMRTFGYVQDPNSDLVGIAIGRNGEIVLNNGRHRVSIAKLLSIPSIPVTIDIRHAQWMEFYKDLLVYASEHDDMVYAPLMHPDLSYIPSRQPDRSDLIIKHMSPKNQSLVDLGANWGLMCHKLEAYVDTCMAVEQDPREFSFLTRFHRIHECSFQMTNDDATSFIARNPHWDCVLMMSLLHHIPEAKRNDFLSRIKAKEMFFQFPSKEELIIDINDWVSRIIGVSCFSRAEKISSNGDREIFHFTE